MFLEKPNYETLEAYAQIEILLNFCETEQPSCLIVYLIILIWIRLLNAGQWFVVLLLKSRSRMKKKCQKKMSTFFFQIEPLTQDSIERYFRF